MEDESSRENFFQNMTFILQSILSNGTANKKLCVFDKKIMQSCSKFAASFAAESEESENRENDCSEQEIPWYESWKLDYHYFDINLCYLSRITSRFINWLLDCSGVTR